jgi:hypothetical protein
VRVHFLNVCRREISALTVRHALSEFGWSAARIRGGGTNRDWRKLRDERPHHEIHVRNVVGEHLKVHHLEL